MVIQVGKGCLHERTASTAVSELNDDRVLRACEGDGCLSSIRSACSRIARVHKEKWRECEDLLRLTRVEANIDSKGVKKQGSLKDFFKGQGLGASAAGLSNSRLRKTFQGGYTKSVHSRVVRRLKEIRRSRENRVD